MADGLLQPERFCATSEEARDNPSGRYWLAKGARASASATTAGPTVGSPTGAVPRAALPPSQAPAILGPTATRAPSTRGEIQLERDVECGAIHTGLAARHDALDAVCGLAIRWGRRAERGAVPRLFG